MATATRAEIETRLRGVSRRLMLRGLARAAFSGLGGASIGVVVSAVLFEGLPRLLGASSPGVWLLFATGLVGFIVGVFAQRARFGAPGLVDSALAMESRLAHDTGALAASLNLTEDSAFAQPVLTRAESELKQAALRKPPSLLTIRQLIVVPGLMLVGGISLSLAYSAPRADPRNQPVAGVTDARQPAPANWADMDIGGERSDDDRAAYREALGLKETAAKLRDSADVLRDAASAPTDRERAYRQAREAMSADANTGDATREMPDALPDDDREIDDIATRIEDYADTLASAADTRLTKSGGRADASTKGEFESDLKPAITTPFPEPDIATTSKEMREPTEAQNMARRELATRAVKALESIQKPE